MINVIKKISLFIFMAALFTSAMTTEKMKEENIINNVPKPVMMIIFNELAYNNHIYPGTLRLVCRRWKAIVDLNISQNKDTAYKDCSPLSQKWLQQVHGVPGHEEIFNIFINGKLFYRPTQESNEGMVVFNILDLKNPFSGSFDLSKCGVHRQYLNISTGFREYKIDNKLKYEIRICPRFLIEKFLPESASYFNLIMEKWNEKTAPIGIFFHQRGKWGNLGSYEYLTSSSIDSISSKNLFENWGSTQYTGKSGKNIHQLGTKNFSIHFVSQNKDD